MELISLLRTKPEARSEEVVEAIVRCLRETDAVLSGFVKLGVSDDRQLKIVASAP